MKFKDKILGGISQSDSLSFIKNFTFPAGYFEPALIVTGFTAIIYLINYYYSVAYFAKISFPHEILNVPILFYLPLMLASASINLILLIITFTSYKNSPETFLQISLSNIIFLAIIIVLILRAITHSVRPSIIGTNVEWLSPAMQCVFFIFLYVLFLKKQWTFFHIYEKNHITGILILIITLLVFSLSFASVLGDFSIERLLHGDVGSYEIKLMLGDTNIEKDLDIHGKTLILIMQSDGNYYVVEKLNETELAVNQYLYVISDSQIEGAAIKRRSSSNWGLRQYLTISFSHLKHDIKNNFCF